MLARTRELALKEADVLIATAVAAGKITPVIAGKLGENATKALADPQDEFPKLLLNRQGKVTCEWVHSRPSSFAAMDM